MCPYFVKILLLLATVVLNSAILALNCTECGSDTSWDDCANRSTSVQCTTSDVNAFHQGLLMFNPGLPVGNYSEFKCFRMKGNFSHPEHGGMGYGQGCTFAVSKFCNGWKNVTVMECS